MSGTTVQEITEVKTPFDWKRWVFILGGLALFATGGKQIFAGKKEKFSDLAILMEDSFQAECKRQGALPVRDFMAPPLKSIKAGMHPLHAAEILMTENETCLPVVEEGILIGVVRLIDIFRALASSCSL